MKKSLLLPLFLLILVFSLTGCGGKKEDVRLDVLEKNGALISTAVPCSAVDEVRNAGIPLEDPPFDTQTSEENGLESVTYLVQDEKFTLNLAGCEIQSSLFQFINGKLSNITVNLTDSSSYEAVMAEMTRLYGAPTVEEPMEGLIMNLWEFQTDFPVRAAVIGRSTDGEIHSGSFQVSYIWFDTAD